ncbi:UNC93-like protein [Trichonephila inaurata madagascariensis]|uniref:UNC93-like protein n=1 Tax=Trichonephila inaurata madagascariensis TaxID=2747483 RepID=A0A8X7BM66_9ARAC|nr:UNC93-like protein [Trichonephila inaurata madagascariensis]
MELKNASVEVGVTSTPKFTKFRILKNLVVISSTFVMLFTAYDGLSMPRVYNEKARDEVRKSYPQTPATSNQASTEVLSITASNTSVEDLTNKNSNTSSVEEISTRNLDKPNVERHATVNLATSYEHYYENSEDLISTPQMKMKYKEEVVSEKRDVQVRRNSYLVNNRFKVRAVSNDKEIDMKRDLYEFIIPTTEINTSPDITMSVIPSRQNREFFKKNQKKTGYFLFKNLLFDKFTALLGGSMDLFSILPKCGETSFYYILQRTPNINNSIFFCGLNFATQSTSGLFGEQMKIFDTFHWVSVIFCCNWCFTSFFVSRSSEDSKRTSKVFLKNSPRNAK